ncbi:MAG: DUF934 domain-containing protein [Pseudomonadales bacterium]|nr:DUF934 domain-containing protein [Pseudomonadales bacterium]
MPKLIKDGAVIANPWELIGRDETLAGSLDRQSANLLVPASLWLENREAFIASGKTIGVWLDAGQSPELLAEHLSELPLIALNFPAFADGRSYSSAFILRHHYHYQGELRAIGDVLRDQLFYMKRCGFDAFDVQDGVKEADALAAFSDFATSYQSTIAEPAPLFRRR